MSAVCLSVFSASAGAGVPSTINYRGRLVDASGAPVVDGVNFIRFVIYDSPTAGTELWNSGIQEVPTSGGLFTYQLGSNTPLPAGLFDGTPTFYLGIKIGADPEITPRTMFTSSAFAHHARRADTATIAQNAILLDGEPASSYLTAEVGLGDITGVTAIDGLTGGGTTGDVTVSVATGGITAAHIADGSIGAADINSSEVQRRVSGSVAAGQAIRAINIDGSVTAVAVGNGDITAVTATGGLTGGGTSGAVTVQVATNGITAAHIASGAVGTDEVALNSLTASDLAPGSVGTSEIFDGSISDMDISSSAGIATSKISGTAVNLSSQQTITGAKTFNNLGIQSTLRKLSISSFAFDASSTASLIRSQFGGEVYSSDFGSVRLFAPIIFPDGATIVRLEGTFIDSHASQNITMRLWRITRANGGGAAFATISSTGSPGFTNVMINLTLNNVVDNGFYFYYLEVF